MGDMMQVMLGINLEQLGEPLGQAWRGWPRE